MTILLIVTEDGWLVLEVSLLVRDRARATGSTGQDRRTRALSWGLIVAAIAVGDVLNAVTSKHSPLRIPGAGPGGWPVMAGLAIVGLGLMIRVWAIATLGRSFRTTVEVDAGQEVVSRGPYRWVRHPSYTGILLMVTGFGLAAGTWPGLAVCAILPAAAMLRRIQIEEAELTRVLGNPYHAYRNRTKRLVPGLW